MTYEWEQDSENGTTLGLEELLRKEVEKSKSLKLERLKLRDKIELLKEENQHLLTENNSFRKKLETKHFKLEQAALINDTSWFKTFFFGPAFKGSFILFVLLLVIGCLIYFSLY